MPDTGRGYTYPASTGSVNIWEHFQALAEDIDADVEGIIAAYLAPTLATGGTVVTAATNFSVNNAYGYLALNGKMVDLFIDINTNNAINVISPGSGNVTDLQIGTLQSAYRPTQIRNAIFSANSGTGEVQIQPDGAIVLRTLDVGITAGGDIRLSSTFMKS